MTAATARLCNLRDLGGLPAGGNTVTRHGVLYRSDVPLANDTWPDEIAHWPPATVLDLRTTAEKHSNPTPFDPTTTTIHFLPLLEGARPTRAPLDEVSAGVEFGGLFRTWYLSWLEQRSHLIASAVTIAATCELPLLVHCSAGRDRTGIVVALLLATADVDRAAIIADYRHTETNHPQLMQRLRARGVLDQQWTPSLLGETLSTPEAIASVLDRFDEHIEGVRGWLTDNSVDGEATTAWRRRLLE